MAVKRRLFITNRYGVVVTELPVEALSAVAPVTRDAQGGGSAGFALAKSNLVLGGACREVERELQVWDEYPDGSWRCEHAGPMLLEPSSSKGSTWAWSSSHVGWYTGGRLVPGAPVYEYPTIPDLAVVRDPGRTFDGTLAQWWLAADIVDPSCADLHIEALAGDSVWVANGETRDKYLSDWLQTIRRQGLDVDIMVYGTAANEAAVDPESVVRQARISPGVEWAPADLTLRLTTGEGAPAGGNVLSVQTQPTTSPVTKMTMVSPEGLRGVVEVNLYGGLMLEAVGTGSKGADVSQLELEALAEIERRVALQVSCRVHGNALFAQIYDRVRVLLPAGTAYSSPVEMMMQVVARSKVAPHVAELTLSGGLI